MNPVCVECGLTVPQLVGPDDVLSRCARCGSACDMYLESDVVLTSLGVALLRKSAWRHVIHNVRDASRLVILFGAATLLQTVLALVCRESTLLAARDPAAALATSHLSHVLVAPAGSLPPTLQIAALLGAAGNSSAGEQLRSLSDRYEAVFSRVSLLTVMDTGRLALAIAFCVVAESVLFAVAVASCMTVAAAAPQPPSASPMPQPTPAAAPRGSSAAVASPDSAAAAIATVGGPLLPLGAHHQARAADAGATTAAGAGDAAAALHKSGSSAITTVRVVRARACDRVCFVNSRFCTLALAGWRG